MSQGYDGGKNGIILGTRPGDVPGEREFSAYAARDYEDELEEELALRKQFEESRARGTVVMVSKDAKEGVGRFVLPKPHYDSVRGIERVTYADHLAVYQDEGLKIKFDPSSNVFHQMIEEELRVPLIPFLGDERRHDGLNNRNDQYYKDYAPLRQNVCVLYNSLCAMSFPDGEYNTNDPQDQAKMAQLREMSKVLAKELKWQSRAEWLAGLLTFGSSDENMAEKRFGKYGQEHFGARHMYELLYQQQEKMSLNPFRWLLGKANKYDWGLPPPEQSVFCRQDLQEVLQNEMRNEDMGLPMLGQTLCDKALEIEGIAAGLKTGVPTGTVAQMNEAQREESVELAREILRRLKEICSSRSNRAQGGVDHQKQDLERAHLMHGLAADYQQLYENLLLTDPLIVNDSTFERARLALGKLGHITMLNALNAADNKEARDEMMAAYQALPAEYKNVGKDTEAALMRDVELAVGEMSRRLHVPNEVSQGVKIKAQAVAANLHTTMTGAHIGAASVNIIDRARDVSRANEQSATMPAMGRAAQLSAASVEQNSTGAGIYRT